MRYVFIVLLLILTLQKLGLRYMLKSNAWNLNAAGYGVWLVYNVLVLIAPEWVAVNYLIDYSLRLLGFGLLILGAHTLYKDLKDLRKYI